MPDSAVHVSYPIARMRFICFVKETTMESVRGPPDISVPAVRAVREMFSPCSFAARANFTSADTSSASLGKATSFGTRSNILASRLHFFRISGSSETSPLMTRTISSRRLMREVYPKKEPGRPKKATCGGSGETSRDSSRVPQFLCRGVDLVYGQGREAQVPSQKIFDRRPSAAGREALHQRCPHVLVQCLEQGGSALRDVAVPVIHLDSATIFSGRLGSRDDQQQCLGHASRRDLIRPRYDQSCESNLGLFGPLNWIPHEFLSHLRGSDVATHPHNSSGFRWCQVHVKIS